MEKNNLYLKERESLSFQSTLSSVPIYFMSLLHMLGVVRLRLEQIQRNFLWEGGSFGMEA